MDDRRKKQAFRLALSTSGELVGGPGEPRVGSRSGDVDSGPAEDVTQSVASILRNYFEAQREEVPYDQIERLVASLAQNGPVENGAILDQLDTVLAKWLEFQHSVVEDALSAALGATATAGFLSTFNDWMERFGLTLKPTPDMVAALGNWAKDQTARLLRLLDTTTRNGVARVIAEGLKEGRSVKEIMRAILDYLNNIIEERPEKVAAKEAMEAHNYGTLNASRTLGATRKIWVTRKDLRVCISCWWNAFQKAIPIEQKFRSGHFHPPAHDCCRCVLAFSGLTRRSVLGALFGRRR
jgi:hypothetical protein